jgi:hypothetical protein
MVDRNQWNGSDLFFVWPFPLCRFVTERVAMFIKKNKLTGVKVIRQDKYHPSHQIAGAMPGRLRSWLPEARAREIGEPLGIY